jgi:hypothetical protein
MTEEQKQSIVFIYFFENEGFFFLVHYALEEMKKSLSFISSKLVTKETRGNLGEYLE